MGNSEPASAIAICGIKSIKGWPCFGCPGSYCLIVSMDSCAISKVASKRFLRKKEAAGLKSAISKSCAVESRNTCLRHASVFSGKAWCRERIVLRRRFGIRIATSQAKKLQNRAAALTGRAASIRQNTFRIKSKLSLKAKRYPDGKVSLSIRDRKTDLPKLALF